MELDPVPDPVSHPYPYPFWLQGYFWMMANCLCTAGYALYLKHATKTIRLSKFGMAYYNNALSVPILLLGAIFRGEFQVSQSLISVTNWPGHVRSIR